MERTHSITRRAPTLSTLLVVLVALFSSGQLSSGQESRTFTSATPIIIADELPGSPYPSTITVADLTGVVSSITITLRGLSHSYPDDLDILLTGPGGIKVMVMSDAGGSFGVNDIDVTLDDAASEPLPNSSQLTTGTFTPANWGGTSGDTFPPPAPAAPYETSLAAWTGVSPDGAWSLFVRDDIPDNAGIIERGWSLTLRTVPDVVPSLTLQLNGTNSTLSWPQTSLGYSLEQTADLGTGIWSAVTNSAVTTNGQFTVTIPTGASAEFFRLRK